MVNVFSFCLYGPENPRYYTGLQGNVLLAGKHFPDWKLYVYLGSDVEPSMIQLLEQCPNVVLRYTNITGPLNMIHRFYAIDEPDVEVMMVRDADSRIHWKDRWAIHEFMNQPEFIAHTIRDNVQHSADMMGGLWGIRKSSGLNMHEEYANYTENTSRGARLGHDQNFLGDVIYPKVVSRMLVHYSNGKRKTGERAVEFPFEWTNDIYCGRIETNFVDRLPPPPKPTIFSFPSPIVRIRDPVFVQSAPQTVREPVREPVAVPNIIKFLHRK